MTSFQPTASVPSSSPTNPFPLHCVAPFSSPVVSEPDKALSTLRSGHVPSFETFSFNWWSQCNILCQSFRTPAAVFVKLTTLSYPFRSCKNFISLTRYLLRMSSEYLNIKIKLLKSQFRLISKKVPPADLSLKLHYIQKNYFEGPKMYTCTVKTLFESMVFTWMRILGNMMCFKSSFFLRYMRFVNYY